MTQKKNKNLIKVLLVVLLLLSFKKKEKVGVFVPADGKFGDFDSDGDFKETFDDKVSKVNNDVAPIGTSVVFDSTQNLKPIVKNEKGNCVKCE